MDPVRRGDRFQIRRGRFEGVTGTIVNAYVNHLQRGHAVVGQTDHPPRCGCIHQVNLDNGFVAFVKNRDCVFLPLPIVVSPEASTQAPMMLREAPEDVPSEASTQEVVGAANRLARRRAFGRAPRRAPLMLREAPVDVPSEASTQEVLGAANRRAAQLMLREARVRYTIRAFNQPRLALPSARAMRAARRVTNRMDVSTAPPSIDIRIQTTPGWAASEGARSANMSAALHAEAQALLDEINENSTV
jgi:hypothetical protein